MIVCRLKLLAFRGFALAAILTLVAGCNSDVTPAAQEATPSSAATTVGAPLAPTGLAATSGNARVTLSWSASAGATSYDIKRSTTSGGPYSTVGNAMTLSYTDVTVSNSSTYYYVIAAVNSGGVSAISAEVNATPESSVTIPLTPVGLTATTGNAQISLTWSASSGASSYNVKRSVTNGGPYMQIATAMSPSYTDAAVSNGSTYYYVVAAANSAGASADSAQISATPVASTAGVSSIVINPTTAVVSYGAAFQFTAALIGAPSANVVWSMQETGNVGTIASDGRYTAPTVTGTFHVVAKSSNDSSLTSTASVTVTAPQGTPPTLTPGVWKDITPPIPGLAQTFGATWLVVSPVDPNVIYVLADTLGIWKTTDRGSNWTRLGSPTTYDNSGKTSYIDSPVRLAVDPADANHLIVTQGVRGATLGFWVSHDAGATWTMPEGFRNSNATNDVTSMEVDPTNFNHILLGSHSPWGPAGNQRTAGIMETKDGGNTWILHEAVSSWPVGSLGINFLYDLKTGQGNSNTWLVGTDGDGFWRTTDAGANWTKVSNFNVTHGGAQLYYTKAGVLYSGAINYPVRSKDNGLTWEQMSNNGLPNFYYYSVVGDGNTLYTQLSNTGDNAGYGLQPYMSASESTGDVWTPYQGGSQLFNNGPYVMSYDAANGIMYSANWRIGIWALKVIKP